MAKQHPAQQAANATETPKADTNQTALTPAQMQAEMDRLRAENDALKGASGADRPITLKVSDKGAVSAYGMGRFPVTLYFEQWTKLLDASEQIRTFLKAHDSELKRKEQRA